MMSELRIGDHVLGAGHPCWVIAEAGINHNGDPSLAHALVDCAADAGADAVKFQTFRPDVLVAASAASAPYQRRQGAGANQYRMLEDLVLPASVWKELAEHARERGLIFLSTAFDPESAAAIVELGVPALKIPSGELNNVGFVRLMADFGLPLLVSTGMGTLDEVRSAVDASAAAPGLALFHCVSSYPTVPKDTNLRAMVTMREAFAVPVGWSDHTESFVTAVAAVALGADLVEKHVTLDRGMSGPDHAASADPESFRRYVTAVRDAEGALGDGVKRPVEAEEENRVHARRSAHAARDLRGGEELMSDDVVMLRPAEGLPPDVVVTGRRVVRDIAAGQPIREGDLE